MIYTKLSQFFFSSVVYKLSLILFCFPKGFQVILGAWSSSQSIKLLVEFFQLITWQRSTLNLLLKGIWHNIKSLQKHKAVSLISNNWYIASWEEEGCHHYSKMFRWEPEGSYCHRHGTAIVPFWFSMAHLWILIAPFWLSTDDIMFSQAWASYMYVSAKSWWHSLYHNMYNGMSFCFFQRITKHHNKTTPTHPSNRHK